MSTYIELSCEVVESVQLCFFRLVVVYMHIVFRINLLAMNVICYTSAFIFYKQ